MTKQTKAQRIVELERKLMEAQAQQIHKLYFASSDLDKISTEKMGCGAVILTLTTLGGRLTIGPVAISSGLSPETIAALKADMVRSWNRGTELKPKGAA